jgi:hypothetical protein
VKIAVSADGGVVRVRPTPILLRKNYRQHRVAALGAFESDIVSKGIAENHFSCFADTTEVRDPCHIPFLGLSLLLSIALFEKVYKP